MSENKAASELKQQALRLGHNWIRIVPTESGSRFIIECACGYGAPLLDGRPTVTRATEGEAVATAVHHLKSSVDRARDREKRSGVEFRPPNAKRERRRAVERARALGPVIPSVPDGGTNEHGEPQLGANQVLVTRTGTAFHTGWCEIVVDISGQSPGRLVVVERSSVGGRQLCRTCRDAGYLHESTSVENERLSDG